MAKTKPRLAAVVLRNVLYNASTAVFGRFVGLIVTIILARLLMPELFGIYALALSIGWIMLTFTNLGINAALIRYVAAALGKKKKALARAYFRYLFKAKFALTVIFSLGIFLAAQPLSIFVFSKPALIIPLQIIALYVLFESLFTYANSTFYAVQQVKYSMWASAVYESGRVILAPALVILGYSVFGALVGITIAAALAALTIFSFLIKRHPYFFSGPIAKFEKRRLWRFIAFLTVGLISAIFFFNIDTLMLGALLPAAEFVGYYKAAFAIVAAVAGLLSVAVVLLPVFTQLEGQRLERAFQKVFRYTAILTFPAAFGLAWIAPPIVKIVYGLEYLPATILLLPLSFLIIEIPFTSLYTSLFTAKEMPKWPTYVILVSTSINIVLNYFMILVYGMIGAAIATLISRYFNFGLLGGLAKIKLSIKPLMATIYKPFLAAVIMVMVLFLIALPTIVEIFLAIIIYFTTLAMLKGFELKDTKYIKNLFIIKR